MFASRAGGAPRGAAVALALAASVAQGVLHRLLYFLTMRAGWNLRVGFSALVHSKALRLAPARSAATARRARRPLVSNGAALRPVRDQPVLVRRDAARAARRDRCCSRSCSRRAPARGRARRRRHVRRAGAARRARRRAAQAPAARSSSASSRTKEALVAIKSIKALGWEERAADALRSLRAAEAASVLRSQAIKAVLFSLFFATTSAAAFAMFATHRASGRELRLVDVYPALALLQVVRQSVGKQFRACGPWSAW